ncbi:MAG: hypothetical protein D6800_02620 [Candidatus Zixiibacteriota bacterium]|nr:MAG: hypothetical protein D6800_02620 [candidate division Zixibacteria bacterium]
MRTFLAIGAVVATTLVVGQAHARTPETPKAAKQTALYGAPAYCSAGHNVGRIFLTVNNNGTFGTEYSGVGRRDCFTGEPLLSCEFPKGSGVDYLYGAALWVGAVVGQDTLVSTGHDGWRSELGAEFHPAGHNDDPPGDMIFRSTLDPTKPEFEGAVSEQDYVSVYYDTCLQCYGVGHDVIDGRPHVPLHLKVTQRSYAWSQPYAEDFVLFDFAIRNIGQQFLKRLYVGIFVDADVPNLYYVDRGASDDLSGFLSTIDRRYMYGRCSPAPDTVNIAYIIDNDGDFFSPWWPAAPGVTGVRFLHTPGDEAQVSFNWWISNSQSLLDYGPQTKARFRDLGTGGQGTPEGDRNKYWYLSNGEIDFDEIYTATITPDDSIWAYPDLSVAPDYSDGSDARYLLSVGPFDLDPGQTLPFALAYVAGENIQTSNENFDMYLNDSLGSYDPDAYHAGLDFSDLALNATWAKWVYDNPGVDTDHDGYAGEYRVCDGDTVWYRGDGVPDWRADAIPVAPVVWVQPVDSGAWIRWNGRAAETTRDWLSRQLDFEGYHVYLADNKLAVQAMVASYDRDDYRKFVWDYDAGDYRYVAPVMTLAQARCLYAPDGCDDTQWTPEDYTRSHPYRLPLSDSIFYFEKVGPNTAKFGIETPILKRFPDAPKPPDNWTADSVPANLRDTYLTDDGFFKYYEYEFTLRNLLPGNVYYVGVTAFDYGSSLPQAIGVGSESTLQGNLHRVIPLDHPVCCAGATGNVNCDPDDVVDINDLTTLIDHLFLSQTPLCCPEEANIDGDVFGTVDVVDLTALIDHLFISLSPTAECQ